MVDRNRAAKSAARAYMKATGVKYTVALRAVSAAHEAEKAARLRSMAQGPTPTDLLSGDATKLVFSNDEDAIH